MSASSSSAVYLVRVPDARWSAEALAALADAGLDPTPLNAGERLDRLPEEGGWLFLPPGLSPAALGRILRAVGRAPAPWGILELEESGGSFRVQPYSLGFADELPAVAARLSAEVERGTLSLRHVLADLSRLRHDANNALTSALAETQFMRMDADEDTELHEGLTLVERQLKRLRDLVAEMSALRVSSSSGARSG